MRGDPAKILVLFAALLGLPGALFGKGDKNAQVTRHVVQVVVSPEASDKSACQKIVDAMSFQMRATQRFTVVDEAAISMDHKVTVSCVGASMQLTWVAIARARNKGSTTLAPTLVRKIKVRRDGSLMRDFEASGLLAAKELLRELPWEGEAIAILGIKSKASVGGELILGEPKKAFEQDFVTLSVGYLEAESIGNCVAFDLGTLQATKGRPKFIKIGEGLVIDTHPFSVEAEAYLKKSEVAADKIYFRIQAPDTKNSQVRRYVRKCKERVGEGATGALMVGGNPNYPGLLSKETIELNMVRQRSGFYLGTFGTTNGLRVPYVVSAYVHNNLEIGDHFDGDMRVYRTILSSNYEGSVPNAKSELTFADVFGGLRKSYLEFTFAAGLGLMLDKMNIPFGLERTVNPEAGTTVDRYTGLRSYKIRSAFYLSAKVDWDEYWAGSRYAFSFSRISPYQQLNADFNLRLTDTWFIGWDMLLERVYPSALREPGGTLINFGGHVGFTIRRAKPAVEKRVQ